MVACLVAFPRSFGSLSPTASAPVIQDLPPGCTVAEDDSLTCTPVPPNPMRRRPGATDALAPRRPRRLEAGGPAFLTPAVFDQRPGISPKSEA